MKGFALIYVSSLRVAPVEWWQGSSMPFSTRCGSFLAGPGGAKEHMGELSKLQESESHCLQGLFLHSSIISACLCLIPQSGPFLSSDPGVPHENKEGGLLPAP